jgi:hypothetical protein
MIVLLFPSYPQLWFASTGHNGVCCRLFAQHSRTTIVDRIVRQKADRIGGHSFPKAVPRTKPDVLATVNDIASRAQDAAEDIKKAPCKFRLVQARGSSGFAFPARSGE